MKILVITHEYNILDSEFYKSFEDMMYLFDLDKSYHTITYILCTSRFSSIFQRFVLD